MAKRLVLVSYSLGFSPISVILLAITLGKLLKSYVKWGFSVSLSIEEGYQW